MLTWPGGQICIRILFQTSPDGNVTLSILNYVPTIRDAGKYMACRAENPELPDATLEDGWKLEIHCNPFYFVVLLRTAFCQLIVFILLPDIPQAVLSLGSSLNGSNIKEGDDVYFECNVRANPKPYKISWRFNVIIREKVAEIKYRKIYFFLVLLSGISFDFKSAWWDHCQ